MLSVLHRDSDIRRKSCPATVNDDLHLEDRTDPLFTPIRSCSITDSERRYSIEDPLKGKAHAHQKLRRFEDELRRTFSRVKMLNNFKKMSSSGSSTPPIVPEPSDEISNGTPERSLHVIHSNALLHIGNKKKQQLAAVEFLLKSDDDYDNDKNANPILSLGSLRNGRFSAGITLNKFPVGGELVIRVSGYKLDFFWLAERPKTGRRGSHTVYNHKPLHCNNVDLPMYVDPQNLDFNLDNETKISVHGKTKGFLCRRKSISTDDLSIGKHFLKTPKQKREKVKKKTVLDETIDDSRTRSYTR